MPTNPPLPGARPVGSKVSDAEAAVFHLKRMLRSMQVHKAEALRHGTCSQLPFQQPRAPSGRLGAIAWLLAVASCG